MMFVRYQVVRNSVLALGGGAVLVAGAAGAFRDGPVEPAPTAYRQPVAPTRPDAPAIATGPSDATVMAAAELSSGGADKRKDALGARSPWKVNLYDDDRDGRWDRLKVDRDRDEVWDASWRVADGRWRDEAGRVWQGGRWVGELRAADPGVVSEDPGAPPPAVDPVERTMLAVARAFDGRATSAKIKDLFHGTGAKVNLYDDDQDGRWDRAKIDHDRDETWDEQLDRKAGVIQRKVAATGQYSDLVAGAWVLRGSNPGVDPKPPTPALDPASATALAVARALDERATGAKVKDLYRGRGAKVNLYDDDQDGRWDRAKIDHDRDETWDEKLDRKAGVIQRTIEANGLRSVLVDGGWQ